MSGGAGSGTGTSAAGSESLEAKRKRKKKGKKDDDGEATQQPVSSSSGTTVGEGGASGGVSIGGGVSGVVASRDELVDHLLAMGFTEPDCLAAIALYGNDMDRALSWLCERPG